MNNIELDRSIAGMPILVEPPSVRTALPGHLGWSNIAVANKIPRGPQVHFQL
jgi:hypothetical protein